MKKIRVAINGYGRIGRAVLRAIYENSSATLSIQVVAINGLGSLSTNAHLTQYDTTHGKFSKTVTIQKDQLIIDQTDYIHFFSEKDITQLPWDTLGIDIVYECTGQFNTSHAVAAHLKAGAKKVLVGYPCEGVDATIIYGVNHHLLDQLSHRIISMGSCTTNALATLIKPLKDSVGIIQGLMTTIHAYTSDQRLLDNHHTDLYRTRSAAQSIIPTKTGATKIIGTIFPDLKDKLKGLAVRVPVPNVSLIDFTFNTSTVTNADKINQVLEASTQDTLKDILQFNDIPLVSSDFQHNPASAIVLTKETTVTHNLAKVLAWYDNEWGFSNRMLDITIHWFSS